MTKTHKSHQHSAQEHSLDDAVARALRDNLAPLQRTLEELQHAYADLAAACASSRPANALPAMLRAQAASASLAGGLGVLSHFVTLALQPGRGMASVQAAAEVLAVADAAEAGIEAAAEAVEDAALARAEERAEEEEARVTDEIVAAGPESNAGESFEAGVPEAPGPSDNGAAPAQAPSFDVESLGSELQEMHRRAKRVAKVAMQDIKMLRPKDVRLAKENKDICVRLRDDLDKARKEYDRRFKLILDHPVDYFHDWLVAILADGDPEALGDYPYPSPVLRH